MKRASLLVARLFLGVCFVAIGWAKVSGQPVVEGKSFSESFPGFVRTALDTGHPFWFWRPILESVVLPNASLFATLVAWGELALGVSLLLGALVSFSAIGGLALMASIQFCTNPFAAPGSLATKVGGLLQTGTIAALLLVLAFHGAGRVLGLDGLLFGKRKAKGAAKPAGG